MLMISSKMDPRDRKTDRVRMGGYPYEGEMRGNGGTYDDMRSYGEMGGGMSGGVESRSRDRRGREHYNNGRYAPRSTMNLPEEMEDTGDDMSGMSRRIGAYAAYRPINPIGFRGMSDSGHKAGHMDLGHAEGLETGEMDEHTAKKWVSKMRGSDGSMGEHWSMDQTSQTMRQRGMDCDPLEFYVAMNMVYSDYAQIAKNHGVNNVDFYADMAKAFLDDADAVDDKLMAYYECVVDR